MSIKKKKKKKKIKKKKKKKIAHLNKRLRKEYGNKYFMLKYVVKTKVSSF